MRRKFEAATSGGPKPPVRVPAVFVEGVGSFVPPANGAFGPSTVGKGSDEVVSRADALRSLGGSLADLRHEQKLTGEALGALVGFSQAKISKIERGMLRPSPGDVQRLAVALRAPAAVTEGLVDLAVSLQVSTQPRRTQPQRGIEGQRDFAVREARAVRVRVFECTVVPGLLQISEYTRQVVNGYFEVTADIAERKWAETAGAVSERAQRQEQLYDVAKSFEFVMFETALLLRYTSPGYMLAQVDRIESAASLPNVTIRIVPSEVRLGFPPLHGFTLLDDDVVLTEVGSDTNILRDAEDIDFYERLFNHYGERGTTDIGSMLDSYRTLYADLARPR